MSITAGRPELETIDDDRCSAFQPVFEIVNKRWTGTILLAVARGAHRFGEIAHVVAGISDRLLSQRLKELEAENLVARTVVPTTPVQIRYTVTAEGRELLAALQPLARWGVATQRIKPE